MWYYTDIIVVWLIMYWLYKSYYLCNTWWRCYLIAIIFFFQAEDGIRDLVRSRGLGDVYKRQLENNFQIMNWSVLYNLIKGEKTIYALPIRKHFSFCLLYTSDAADERSSVDLGGRRIIKKKKTNNDMWRYVEK